MGNSHKTSQSSRPHFSETMHLFQTITGPKEGHGALPNRAVEKRANHHHLLKDMAQTDIYPSRKEEVRENSTKLNRPSFQSSKSSIKFQNYYPGKIHPGIQNLLEETKIPQSTLIAGKTKFFQKELGQNNPRPMHPENHFRLANPNNWGTNPKETTKTNKFRSKHESSNTGRDKNFTGKRVCKESSVRRGSISVYPVFEREKGTREIQTRSKPEGTQLSYSVPKIQDGDPEGCQEHPSERGLHVQSGLKRTHTLLSHFNHNQ